MLLYKWLYIFVISALSQEEKIQIKNQLFCTFNEPVQQVGIICQTLYIYSIYCSYSTQDLVKITCKVFSYFLHRKFKHFLIRLQKVIEMGLGTGLERSWKEHGKGMEGRVLSTVATRNVWQAVVQFSGQLTSQLAAISLSCF